MKIVSSWIQQIVHGVGIVKGESSAHCAGVRVSKRPSSCLTTLSSLLVPICQWTRFLDISYKQFLSKVMILAQRSTHKQLSTPDFFPPKDNPFACFITPWWCESVFRFPLSVILWPVSLIRAKTGDNWWFGTKIVIYHFLLSHNWGAETDGQSLNTDGSIYYHCQWPKIINCFCTGCSPQKCPNVWESITSQLMALITKVGGFLKSSRNSLFVGHWKFQFLTIGTEKIVFKVRNPLSKDMTKFTFPQLQLSFGMGFLSWTPCTFCQTFILLWGGWYYCDVRQ